MGTQKCGSSGVFVGNVIEDKFSSHLKDGKRLVLIFFNFNVLTYVVCIK